MSFLTAKEMRKIQRVPAREEHIQWQLKLASEKKVRFIKYRAIGQALSKRIVKKLEIAGYTVEFKYALRKCPDYGSIIKCWDYVISW
jgi:hypothetical protein